MINNAKRDTETITSRLMLGSLILLPEALVRVLLLLLGEIVTAVVSWVTMRAHGSQGGGWATKNTRCGKQGSMVIS